MPALTRRIVSFLVCTAAALSVVPLINVTQIGAHHDWLSALYDTTALWAKVNGPLAQLGVSTRPEQVVVGRAGWLFAGNQYSQTISAKRRDADSQDDAADRRRAAATEAWSQWLERQGVEDWRILVCPDKDGIYPELLPAWYRLAKNAPIDSAMRHVDPRVVIDVRPAMHMAHATETLPLYLRTDTHWTERGAFVAYDAWARSEIRAGGHLAWLDTNQVDFNVRRIPAGDLARVLQISDAAGDLTASVIIGDAKSRGRTLADAFTGRSLALSTLARVETPTEPIITRSPGALNTQRLLWLHDSFGAALRPFVDATFSEVIELDRETATPARFEKLVRDFHPNRVLISVVERNARSPWFEGLPTHGHADDNQPPNSVAGVGNQR